MTTASCITSTTRSRVAHCHRTRAWWLMAVVALVGVVSGCTGRASNAAYFRSSSSSSSSSPSPSSSSAVTFPSTTPPDAFAAPAEPSAVVDVPTAERVFRALYGVRSAAVHAHRADVLQRVETGAILEYDVARCALGCPTPPVTSPDVMHTFSAPAQTGYPAFFMARVSRTGTEGQAVNEIVVFTRAAANSPWLIALDSATQGPNPLLEDANAGFGRPVASVPGFAPDRLANAYAAYWQHWWDEGTNDASSPLYFDDGLTARGQAIYKGHATDVAFGRQEERSYVTDPSAGLFTVSGYADQPLTCGATRFVSRYTPAADRSYLEQDAAQTMWGRALAPGQYREIEVRGLEVDCFLTSLGGLSSPFYLEPLETAFTATPVR